MSEMVYIWQERPAGVLDWGTIAAVVPRLAQRLSALTGETVPPVVPLITANRVLALGPLARVAQEHHEQTGHPVRLAAYRLARVEVEMEQPTAKPWDRFGRPT